MLVTFVDIRLLHHVIDYMLDLTFGVTEITFIIVSSENVNEKCLILIYPFLKPANHAKTHKINTMFHSRTSWEYLVVIDVSCRAINWLLVMSYEKMQFVSFANAILLFLFFSAMRLLEWRLSSTCCIRSLTKSSFLGPPALESRTLLRNPLSSSN